MAFRNGKATCVLCGDPGGGGVTVVTYRTDVVPAGDVDNINAIFATPEYFQYAPGDPMGPQVYINGLRQRLGVHYSVSESGGVGMGYDTITFVAECIPQTDDLVTVDYFLAA